MDEGKEEVGRCKNKDGRKRRKNLALVTWKDTLRKIDTRPDTNNLRMQGKVDVKKDRWLSGRE